MVIEKGGEIGNHGFSGAVVDPRALHELFPGEDITGGLDAPVDQRRAVVPHRRRQDQGAVHAAGAEQPRQVRRLALEPHQVARREGRRGRRRRLPGVSRPGAAVGRRPRRSACASATRASSHDGKPKSNYEPGADLMAKVVVLGEGPRGTLAKTAIAQARPRPRPRSASLRGRHQGALARPRPARGRQRDPHARRAAAGNLRRRLDLRHERRHHRHRSRDRARLRRPDHRSAQQLPALQAASRRSARCSRAAR